MATTLELAEDEILSQLKDVWEAGASAVVGGSPAVNPVLYYELQEYETRPTHDEDERTDPWARISIRHSMATQRTLAQDGLKLFRHQGYLTVQVFSRYRNGAGVTVCQRLANLVRSAYEGRRTPNVWFRNVRYNEMSVEGPWYQINVVCEFEWNSRS